MLDFNSNLIPVILFYFFFYEQFRRIIDANKCKTVRNLIQECLLQEIFILHPFSLRLVDSITTAST